MPIYITPRVLSHAERGDLWAVEQSYLEYFASFTNADTIEILSPYTRLETKNYQETYIILTGGNDVSPELYGDDSSCLSSVNKRRDAFEYALIKEAVSKKIPLLGICRGVQLLNVYFGGKLTLHVNDKYNHPIGNHPVNIDIDSAHQYDSFDVNSFHNHGIEHEHLGNGLATFATSDSGKLVEGLYHTELPVAGVLWHPERGNMDGELNRYLIESFLKKELFWSTHD